MNRKIVTTLIVVAFVFMLVIPVLGKEVPVTWNAVTWNEFSASLKKILGGSGAIPPGIKGTEKVTRLGAVRTIVQTLSYDDLLTFVDSNAKGYQDLKQLNPEDVKIITLASSLQAPLITADTSKRFRPDDLLTVREWSVLQERVKTYAQGNILFESSRIVEPGIFLLIRKQGFGQPVTTPVANGANDVLQAGAYSDMNRAQNMVRWLKELGYDSQVVEESLLFKVQIGPFPDEEITKIQEKLHKQGFNTVIISLGVPAVPAEEPIGGAVFSLALLFDPHLSHYSPEVALAHDTIMKREKTSELAQNKNAFFAMNAGFFTKEGDPLGLLMIKRKILSEPQKGWYVVGLTGDKELMFGEMDLKVEGFVENRTSFPIHGINRFNRGNEIVIFDRNFNGVTPETSGAESIVVNAVIQKTGKTSGKTPIPDEGLVLQGKGERAEWMLSHLFPDARLKVKLTMMPKTGEVDQWEKVEYIISSGPLLYQNGTPGPFGNFNKNIIEKKNPRAVIAQTQEGKILFLAIDGRNPGHSVGMTITELVEELKIYNVTDALNLDGGGSVTFYLNGAILNQPSDLTGERKISTAIILR